MAAHRIEVNNKRMGVLHGPAGALVLGYADPEGRVVAGVPVEDLVGGCAQIHGKKGEMARTPWVSRSAELRDFDRALGEGEDIS